MKEQEIAKNEDTENPTISQGSQSRRRFLKRTSAGAFTLTLADLAPTLVGASEGCAGNVNGDNNCQQYGDSDAMCGEKVNGVFDYDHGCSPGGSDAGFENDNNCRDGLVPDQDQSCGTGPTATATSPDESCPPDPNDPFSSDNDSFA